MLIDSCKDKESSQGKDFLSKVGQIPLGIVDDSEALGFFDNERNPIAPAMQMLPVGDVRPKGWILDRMRNDLKKGIVGALDDMYPAFGADDIFNKDRRGGLDDVPEMGDIVLTGAEWEQSIMWWNSETMGNWFDGFVRHAYLTGDKEAMSQAKSIVENLVNSQDRDGYIGIYKPNLRYRHKGSNGELWAKTTAFRTMLGYYELTGDRRVLNSVERAMGETMNGYGKNAGHPFKLRNAFGGVTHGLMITDVCETLHRITGKQVYLDYAVYLYRSFSDYSVNRAFNDLRYPFLAQKDSLFTGHGVHTYEHFRTLVNAYYATGYPELKEAYENSLYKLEKTLLPGGAGHAMEWIAGMTADPDETASEFCSMLELRNSFGSIAQKTGDVSFADKAEKLTFNGIMGFVNPEGTALAYGKHDNEYVFDGHARHGNQTEKESRYKYSPMHDDPAVCCVPNYTRNFSYYVGMMWMKRGDGVASVLYGPSVLKTTVRDREVEILQETDYPFSDRAKLTVKSSGITFPVYLRKPSWSSSMKVLAEGAKIREEGAFFVVEKEWKEDEIEIIFENELKLSEFGKGKSYFQRGPLVYAYEIPSRREAFREHIVEGFSDYYVYPTDESYKNWELIKDSFEFKNERSGTFSWAAPSVFLAGRSIDREDGSEVDVKLRPMGGTALRKVTFPVIDK